MVTEIISRQMRKLATKAIADIEQAMAENANGDSANRLLESRMAGAISLALCRLNKTKNQFDSCRIAVISASTDSTAYFSSQYMNFMNAFFTAQKMVSVH